MNPSCNEWIPTEGSPLTVILLICIVLLLALIVVVILFKFKDSLLPKRNVQDEGGEQRTGYELVTINTTERQSSAHVTSKEARSKIYTQCESLSRTNLNESYSNMEEVPVQQLPTSISVKDLGLYIYTHNSKFFQDEFKRIPEPANVTYKVGLSKQNNRKNRYKDIIPYDHSRVHLQALNEPEDDYINASYVRDHQNRHKYIATQGPNFVSLNDFIRMLWEQKVEQVVMLTHLDEYSKEKCEQYWPTSGTKEYGTIEVRLTHTKNFTNYIVRYLELVKDQEAHKVTQYHYISWPDHGVPSSPWALVEFEQRVSALKTSTPLVVHCSAGVGRTGTFIALLNIMQQAEQTGQVDIFSTVVKLRQDRLLMVQTA
uniref:protein-tyrosine-phosphatase n=1 Tax=Biomphalaria glabrata TaxID=6526 RepID=A0A2C9LLG6_BIOGL